LEFQTHYLLVVWLNGKYGAEGIERYVSAWLKKFAVVLQVSFVIPAWLSNGGEPATIQSALGNWLALYERHEQARFVYSTWLEAGGDRTVVEEPIRRWLEHHAEAEPASYVYSSWLDAGGDRGLVEEPIRRWLEQHAVKAEPATFVYSSWLNAGGDCRLVEEPIRRWLVDHAESESARFIYAAWLDAGGALDVVESRIAAWAARNWDSPSANFVIVPYLKRRGAFEPVRQAALASMTRLRESPDGSFVSKALAPVRELPDQSVLDILAWCKCFSEDSDALWRLSQLQEKIARPAVTAEACAVAELVLGPWLDASSVPEREVANNVAHVLSALTPIHVRPLREYVTDMLLRWLRHPMGLDVSDWCRYGGVRRLARRVKVLLDHGRIDKARDAAAIERFARWAHRCDPSQPYWFVAPPRAQSTDDPA